MGAGTVRTERYGRIVPDASRRALRRERGLSEEPLACIVSGRMALDEDLPLLQEPAARVAAEIGVLAFKLGYARWTDPARDADPGELATHTRAAFDELRAAAAELH